MNISFSNVILQRSLISLMNIGKDCRLARLDFLPASRHVCEFIFSCWESSISFH